MKISSRIQHPASRIFLLFAFIIFSFSAVSCEDDDVCVGEGTPYLTVVFRNSIEQENLSDSLLIERLNVDNSVLDTVLFWTVTDSIKLPLGGLDETETNFRIRKKMAGTPDVLTVNYNTKSSYVSKACGFRVTYDNLDYNTTFNEIQNIIPNESNVLENESVTNLYIFYNN